MMKKRVFLTAILVVFVLVVVLAVPAFADEQESRTARTSREVPVYMFALHDDTCSDPLSDLYDPAFVDVAFAGGGYFRALASSPEERSRSVNSSLYFDSTSFYWDYFFADRHNNVALNISDNLYTVQYDRLFYLTERYYVYFGDIFIGLFDIQDNSSYLLADHLVFRLDDGNGGFVYFGCSADDFVEEVSVDDIVGYARSLGAPPATLVDWFFDTAFPLFGSVDDSVIDLGILGSYKPMQVYKFLFCLSLVVVAIVLFVWLPMYGLFRLLGIKKKKR